MAIDVKAAVISAGTVVGILYILCVVFFLVAPSSALAFGNLLFHGVDLTKIARDSMTLGSTALGFVVMELLTMIVVWMYARLYNRNSRAL